MVDEKFRRTMTMRLANCTDSMIGKIPRLASYSVKPVEDRRKIEVINTLLFIFEKRVRLILRNYLSVRLLISKFTLISFSSKKRSIETTTAASENISQKTSATAVTSSPLVHSKRKDCGNKGNATENVEHVSICNTPPPSPETSRDFVREKQEKFREDKNQKPLNIAAENVDCGMNNGETTESFSNDEPIENLESRMNDGKIEKSLFCREPNDDRGALTPNTPMEVEATTDKSGGILETKNSNDEDSLHANVSAVTEGSRPFETDEITVHSKSEDSNLSNYPTIQPKRPFRNGWV